MYLLRTWSDHILKSPLRMKSYSWHDKCWMNHAVPFKHRYLRYCQQGIRGGLWNAYESPIRHESKYNVFLFRINKYNAFHFVVTIKRLGSCTLCYLYIACRANIYHVLSACCGILRIFNIFICFLHAVLVIIVLRFRPNLSK